MRISGRLSFDEPVAVRLGGARVSVRLLHVSRADSASITLAEQVIDALPPEATTAQPIMFQFEAPEVDVRSALDLAAHVDLDRSGMRSAGDFITMESHPIDPRSSVVQTVLKLRRIR